MSFVPVTHIVYAPLNNSKTAPHFLRDLAASGVKNIVLSSSVVSDCMKEPYLPECIRKWAEDAGLSFMDGHALFPDCVCPSFPVEEKRDFMLNYIKMELAIAHAFGVKTFTIHTGNNFDRTLSVDVYREAMYRSMEKLLPEAEKNNVIIALENIWTSPNTPEVLLDVMKKFDSPNLGLCYDSGHANIMKYAKKENSPAKIWWNTPEEIPQDDQILEKMLPYVVNCHLHDNCGERDDHFLPGKGNINWDHIMGLLKKAPRLKCIQNEASYANDTLSTREVVKLFDDLCEKGGC